MRYSQVLVVLMAFVVVTMAVKKKREPRCTMSYSPCTDGTTNVTFSDNPNNKNTKFPCKRDAESMVQCVVNKTISRKGCGIDLSSNITPCGEGSETFNVTNSFSSDKKCGKFANKFANKFPAVKTMSCKTDMNINLKEKKKADKQAKKQNKAKTQPKRRKNGKQNNNKKNRRGKKNKDAATACKYQPANWGQCDPVTNIKTKVMPIYRGYPSSCNKTLVVTKQCKSRRKHKVCKYRRGTWSVCDGATNIKRMVKTLKRGPSSCSPTQVKEKICKRVHKGLKGDCIYRKRGRWGDCDPDTGLKSRELVLKRGSNMCPQTKKMSKPCRKKLNGGKNGGCKYDKNQWGPCNAATNTVSRTLTLRPRQPATCNTTKVEVRKCKDKHLRPHVCKYRRTTWGECDPATNMRVMVKTLKRGDPSHCQPTSTTERKCKAKKDMNECKYKFEAWGECDETTNTMTRRQVLKSGPATCQKVKEYSKKCKKPCRFKNGDWSPCDPETNQMTRTDTLSPKSADFCPPTRVLSKKCGKKGKSKCQYDYGEWGDCDDSPKSKRIRVQKLIGDHPNCPPEKISMKPCQKPSGEDRCFFGPWQEFEPCQNGVMKKRRDVLQGGLECEKKGVKMKAC